MLRNAGWSQLWPRALTPAVRAMGGGGVRAARVLDAVGAADAGDRMALLLTMQTLADSPFALLQPQARAHLESRTDPFLAYRRSAERFRDAEPVQQMLLTDICLQLPSQFLPKVDRATMAMGVEARVPLLDERIVELASGMPSAWKVRGAQTKIVLRDAMRERLPAEILDGPKTGFGVPYGHWLRGPLQSLARECLLDSAFVDRFQLDRERVHAAMREHDAGRERGFVLWKLLQLALWSRECRH